MMFVRRFIFIVLAFCALGVSAHADILGSMDQYYAKSKNQYVSQTNGGAYSTQSRHVATGGSYVWRAEQQSAQLLTARLPSIKAGCGGIDIFGGSFSFVNGEQLEALLRAIIQDAAGYAFMLAIEEISPIISGNLKTIQDMIQKVNSTNINSCQAAKALVDNSLDAINGSVSTTCAVRGAAHSIFPDALAGMACGDQNPGTAIGDIKKQDEADGEIVDLPTNQNYAMKATSKSSFKDDIDLREFYMSLTGTLLITTGDEGTEMLYVRPIGLDESVVRALMSGGEILGHSCAAATIGGASYTVSDCLDVSQFTNEIDIPADKGFLVRVETILGSIYDKAAGADSSDLTEQEIAFVENTPIPVYKAAMVMSQAHPEVGKSLLMSYSELIAYNLALEFLEKSSREVLEASQNNVSADRKDYNAWKEGVERNIVSLTRMQAKLQQRVSVVQQYVNDLDRMEAKVRGNVNSNLLRAVNSTRGY